MAVKASATITISTERDIQSVTRYYKLQSSTAAAPSKPKTNPPPSGWDDTEPSYTSGSTNTLYFCDLTVFSTGSPNFSYSEVSKSSSYEAAKEAYGKAVNAENNAKAAQSLAESADMKLASWCAKNDDTLIEGSKIYTESITALQIAANTITAAKCDMDSLKSSLITANNIKALNLEVGNHISMGANAKISWSNVTSKPSDLAHTGDIPTKLSELTNDSGYQTASQVTQITKDTITTSYVNALNVTAKYLDVADLKAIGATIGGFTIGNSALYNGTTTLAGADNSVYLGLDGISCGTKFKVDKKGVLSTADIKMEKTYTEGGITSTFGTYISSPDTWTGSGIAVPEIKTKTKTVVNGVTHSNTLTMYPFRISLEQYATGTDNTWLRLEPTKLSMFSYINNNGFKVPELFIQPAGANSTSSVTLGKEAHQIYSVKWTDDPYDYPDDPLASCPHDMYPIDINASTVTFNSAVAVKDQGLELYHATPYIDFHFGNSNADYTSRIIESASGTLNVLANLQVKGTAVSLSDHTHARLYNGDFNVVLGVEDRYGYFRPPAASKYYNGSSGYPWYKTYTERLEVTKERIVCKPTVDTTTTYAANVYVGTTGIFTKYKASTSSKYIKHDIKELQDESINAERLYDVDVVQFKYNEGELPDDDQRYLKDLPGFIIENMAEVYPIAVDKQTEDSKGWSWNDHYIIPPMLKLIQNQHKEIEAIKAELKEVRKE